MNTDLSLVLEFEPGIASVDIIVQDRNETILADIKQLHDRPVKVNCKIKLPNKISIILNNQNNITDNKFVKLSNLWLGNIEINQQTLLQMCKYKSTQSPTTKFSTVWNVSGIVTIDLFDKDFTSFLLHFHNHIEL
jgi:hypothetical protein